MLAFRHWQPFKLFICHYFCALQITAICSISWFKKPVWSKVKSSKNIKITYLSKNRTILSSSRIDFFSDLSTYHPESIYFRPLSGHLYLGHIDSLGRYRSETQSGPLAKLLISKEKKSFTITFKSWGQSQKDNEKGMWIQIIWSLED